MNDRPREATCKSLHCPTGWLLELCFDTKAPLCGSKTLQPYWENTFYLCVMNVCASQIFWSISSSFIWDPCRILLNFNGSHKVSVVTRRLLLSFANCRQSCVILYFHYCSIRDWCYLVMRQYLTFYCIVSPVFLFITAQIKKMLCISLSKKQTNCYLHAWRIMILRSWSFWLSRQATRRH